MEAIGNLTNGEKVFKTAQGKYVDGNGNKVDGRKVKKFSKKNEIIKEKKTTPKSVWGIKAKNIYNKEFYDADNDDWYDMDELDKKYWDKFYKDQEAYENGKIDAFGNVRKPVIKKNEIIKEKKTTPKPEPKKTQGKQTTDQLEKRRLKYQENREKELARKRAYREANKEKINAKQDETRKTEKSKEYQKAYRDKNAKIPEPRRTKNEVMAGVKAGGLEKGVLRYMDDTNKLIKKYGPQTPRKVRTDVGKKRADYKKKEKKKYIPYDIGEPKQKSGESSDVFETRQGLWNLVRQGKLSPANLTMRKAVLLLYGDGIVSGGEEMTTAEWIRRIEKGGRDIEKDGLGVGNLGQAEEDPDAVY